jgi:hypothetical protein
MVEIEQEMKDQMKEHRLNQYKQQIFTLQMDIVALKAVGDKEGLLKAGKSLEGLEKAFAAVEVM